MKNSLARPFLETLAPVFVLDPRRTIVFCNPALTAWTGTTSEQLLGRRCDYHSRDLDEPVSHLLAALAPPPEAFTGQITAGTIQWSLDDRTGGPRRVRYAVLPRRDEQWLLAVCAAEDQVGGDGSNATAAPSDDLHHQLRNLLSQIQRRYRADRLLGDSPLARRLREQFRIAVDSRARVLLVGPPGSGREHLARIIHGSSPDTTPRNLLPLVCPLLDPELLEAALDAFLRPGGTSSPPGNRAVLLLDVDQLPHDTQQLLMGLVAHGRRPIHTLATARRPLMHLAAEGTFRSDLAAWLSSLVIELPALSSRRADLPMLAQAMLEEYNASQERQLSGFQPDALEALAGYAWPENLDELHAVVWSACRHAASTFITVADLPESVRRAAEPTRPERAEESIVLDTLLADIEREVISRALRRTKGNKARAARLLGLARARLLRRIEQLGLQ